MKLKNIKRKRLNNKGFTLIELLAVVVILAVVMGIAMTSVLSAMNKSRQGSLEDSAKSVAQAFQTKYSESMVSGTANNVYSDVTTAFNFSTATTDNPVAYYLDEGLADDLNISPSTYRLIKKPTSSRTPITITDKKATVGASFVIYNGRSFEVCMLAEETGSYYVANSGKTAGSGKVTVSEVEFTFSNNLGTTTDTLVTTANQGNVMYSCSVEDGNSWSE